jgi:hypothetical protein
MLSPRLRTGLSWAVRLIAAAILGMAGVMKVAAASDPVALFTLLGAEPWGRVLVGSLEILTTALVLWPRTAVYGGILGFLLMLGAIGTHLLRIGITYGGDASLFMTVCLVLVATAVTIALIRDRLTGSSAGQA